MNKLFETLLCFIGSHDWEQLPSPEGIMTGLFGPRKCRRCPEHFDGFPDMKTPMPVYKQHCEQQGENIMPGPVSDSYDPEFGTSQNAYDVKDGIKEVISVIGDLLGLELKYIVEVAQGEDMHHKTITFSERQLRLIRFCLNRALDSI